MNIETEIIRTKIPRTCVCPVCGKEQIFKKQGEYLTKRKDLSLDSPRTVIVHRIKAKCLNPQCKRRSFVLPCPGLEKYQRCTLRVKEEAINKNVLENVTYPRAASALARSFNVTGSKSSIDRWKQREAEKYNFKDIIARLEFSGVLCIDEYKPKRSKHYDSIATDALKPHILYLESVPISPLHAGSIGRGNILKFCYTLKGFGINPWAILVDLLKAYPKQLRKVWPEVKIQFDYFHVMQKIHSLLKRLLFGYTHRLKKSGSLKGEELWENRWRILKNMENWVSTDHRVNSRFMEVYEDTLIEKIFLIKEWLHNIFDLSTTKEEAHKKRDLFFKEPWIKDFWHFRQIVKFLGDANFQYMTTYLEDNRIPRWSNIETLTRSWRQMEKVRYGFKSEKGRQNHLKLYQVKHYLKDKFAPNSGKL